MYKTTEIENTKERLAFVVNHVKKDYDNMTIEELAAHLNMSKNGRNLRELIQASDKLILAIEDFHAKTT